MEGHAEGFCYLLEQANSKTQSTIKELSYRVNAVVNAVGYRKNGNDLTRKLKSSVAEHFDVNNKNPQELRRLQWTTCSNLKVWCDTWKFTLVSLGFARLKNTD